MATDITDLTAQLVLPQQLLDIIGTFWSGLYEGADVIATYAQARGEAEYQTRNNLQECNQLTGLTGAPLYQRIRWQPLTIKQSELLVDERLTYQASDGLGASASTTLNNHVFDYALPADMTLAPLIVNNAVAPTLVWATDVDYMIDTGGGRIRFLSNPFADSRLDQELFYNAAGGIVDRELTLWFFAADFDRSYLLKQFGYILGVELATSEQYKDLLNALWDALLVGTCRLQLDRALASFCDAPIVLTATETVIDVTTETDRKLVITDKNVYVCGSAANVIVSVGQVLSQGAQITDAVKIIDLGAGTPSAGTLASLTLPVTQLNGGYVGGLTFTNADVALQVSTVASRTKVQFSLGGVAGDETLFWDTVHTNGTAAGARTLAQLLDLRAPAQQVGDPDVNSLPSVINPLNFLVSNVLRNAAIVIKFKSTSFGTSALDQTLRTTLLRLIVPPQYGVYEIDL